MPIQFIDLRLFSGYVVDAWQNHLNTEMDPANGQWYTNGPGNNGGLYGLLTDQLASQLVFDTTKQVFTPHQVAAASGIVNNLNGLTPSQTVSLLYSYQDSSTTTHATTNTFQQGISVAIKAGEKDVFEVTTTLSFQYSYSWTDTTSTTTSETKTFTESIPTTVPSGKVYQVLLMCNKQDLSIPYSANVYLTGTSTANFASPVQGHTTWSASAGDICAWINQFGSAGGDSYMFGRDPQNPQQGILTLPGKLTATTTANFSVMTLDVTSTFNPSQSTPLPATSSPGANPVPGSTVVNQTPLAH
jgi:hypothetical protein